MTAGRLQIDSLLSEFRQILVGESPNWQAVLDKAIAAGATIGGCALAELAQQREPAPAPVALRSTTDEPRSARQVLEEFRERHANGAIYRTPKGEL